MNSRERRKNEAEAHNYQMWLEKNARYNRIDEKAMKRASNRNAKLAKKMVILSALSMTAFGYSPVKL
jgi:hypothetical protein